jgi:serine protease Do
MINRFFPSLFAGLIGGVIAIGAWQIVKPEPTLISNAQAPLGYEAKVVNYGAAPPTFDFSKASDRSMQSVVHIKASESKAASRRNQDPYAFLFGNPQRSGSGSGVIYTSDGYIITNNHVIDFADEFLVTLHDKREYKARLVGKDGSTDMAIIKIEAENLVPITLANSDETRVGEWVLAVGNPFDIGPTVTAGIVSAKGRDIGIIKGSTAIESFIQTDAAVNPGNSGGALVDLNGNLIGINSAIASPTGTYAGYAFAIPSNLVKRIGDDLIKYGTFKRAYLGVDIREMDNELAKEMGVKNIQGVAVLGLDDKGSAAQAGVLNYDIIMRVNNKRTLTVPELQEAISQSRVGDTLTLIVQRDGKEKEIQVKMRSRTSE